jgi:hypothetical protein
MRVEADVFSGVPNPCWDLTANEMHRLVEMLQNLPKKKTQVLEAEGLGYRGFYVSEAEGMDRPFDKLHVYRGTLEVTHADAVIQLADKDRRIEYWLLGTGRQHLSGGLFDKISSLME